MHPIVITLTLQAILLNHKFTSNFFMLTASIMTWWEHGSTVNGYNDNLFIILCRRLTIAERDCRAAARSALAFSPSLSIWESLHSLGISSSRLNWYVPSTWNQTHNSVPAWDWNSIWVSKSIPLFTTQIEYLRNSEIKQGFTSNDAHVILPWLIQKCLYDA